MQYPRVKPRLAEPSRSEGVFSRLDDLVRMRAKASGFTFLPRQPVTSILAGRHASRLRGRGLNFEEVRHYLPGDDIRNMDWKVTARLGEPHVRVYSEERDRPTLMLVDQRSSMFFGSQRVMKSVSAAETAALGAWRVLESGDRVGALVFNDGEISEIAPHRSQQQVMHILAEVVRQNEKLGSSPAGGANAGQLNEALRRAARVVKHDFLVCLVTDGFGADQESERLVTMLCEHNDVLIVFVYDPLEAGLPDAGRLVMSEADLQLEVNTSDASLRQSFQEHFQARQKRISDLSKRRTIPMLTVSTVDGVAEQIRQQLGHTPPAVGVPHA